MRDPGHAPGHEPDREFTRRFLEVAPALHAWARLRLAGEAADAEDVVQEVWLRGSREFERFDPRLGSFRVWIFQVTKFALLDALRARAAQAPGRRVGRASTSTAGGPDPLRDVPDAITTLSRRIARDEAMGQLLLELDALSTHLRELAVLCGLEGRTTADAARLLGIPPETARKQWQRLRARLVQNRRILDFVEP